MTPTSTPARVPRRDALARAGEELAARHLISQGFSVLARNWRCPTGEIDLLLLDGGVLVVCEVKTRRGSAYGHPLEAITAAKLRRLRQLAGVSARAFGVQARGLRVDAVGILWPVGGSPTLRHVRGVG